MHHNIHFIEKVNIELDSYFGELSKYEGFDLTLNVY